MQAMLFTMLHKKFSHVRNYVEDVKEKFCTSLNQMYFIFLELLDATALTFFPTRLVNSSALLA